MILTKAEFSRQLRKTENGWQLKAADGEGQGVNKSTVTRWANAGRLVLSASKQVLVEDSLNALNASDGFRTDLAERHALSRGDDLNASAGRVESVAIGATNATQGTTSPALLMPQESAEGDGLGKKAAQLKATALNAKNNQALLKDELSEGTRLYRDYFEQDIATEGNKLKSAVERLIDNMAPQIAALKDKAERQQFIDKEVELLIEQLA